MILIDGPGPPSWRSSTSAATSDCTEEREGWRSKDAWVGARLGAVLIGGSLYDWSRATGSGHPRTTRTRSG